MAELTRYLVHDQDAYEDADGDYYRADEIDALLKKRDEEHCFAVLDSAKLHGMKIDQLQRDLDAAYAALRDVMDDLGDSLNWMEQDHAEVLKKAKEAKDAKD
jgi:hypothetical protein